MIAARKRSRRIVILCEGKTEELAVRHFISRQWEANGLASIGLDSKNLRGSLDKVASIARNYLDEPGILAVFTVIDLYRMNRVRHSVNDELETKVRRVQAWLRDQLGRHPRESDFRPHVSVHEVEAWVLAEGNALAKKLRDPTIGPDPNAEEKNFQHPPHERLRDLFRRKLDKRYQKIEDGEPLFSKMQFQPVYETCRYFREFYDDLKAAPRG
jgi:hypothetical protein